MKRHAPPPECPPDWHIAPPDFVGVGAQRCGTTWWHGLLMDHPGVARAEGVTKELHFFDRFVEDAAPASVAEDYARYFPRPGGALAGEWTPRYMLDFWAPALLSRCAPAAKLLVMLRDPVERYRSGMALHLQSMRTQGASLHPMASANHVLRSLYDLQLSRVLAHFPRGQLLVLQYEACVRDPGGELDRTYRFVGLDPGHRPAALAATSNASETDLKPHPDRELAALLAGDARALGARFPEIDLSLWPTAAQGS